MATSVGAAAAAATARAQREMREHFETQSAFDSEHAVAYEAPDRIHERQRDLLIGRGILRETGDGRYWIDRDAMRLDEERRKAAAMIVLKIVVIATAIAVGVTAILAR